MVLGPLLVSAWVAAQPPGDPVILAPSPLGPGLAPGSGVGELALAVQGLDLEALRRDLELRAPGSRITLDRCGEGCAAVSARRAPDGRIELQIRLADGRVYARSLQAVAEPERATAASLAHLLAAIADGTERPIEAAVPAAAPAASVAPAPVVLAEPRGEVARPAVAAEPVDPRRLELGAALALATAAGVGPPRALAGWVGSGLAGALELRGRRGWLVGFGLRHLQQRDSGFGLHRARVGLSGGYALQRGLFELRVLIGVVVEPWWVVRRGDGTRAEFGRPLLGGAASVTPGVAAWLGRGVGVRAGLRLEAAASAAAGTASAIQADAPGGPPLFRLGGVELAASAEIGLRWDLAARSRRR